MDDHEIREKLRALDKRDDVDLSSWEAEFMESFLRLWAVLDGDPKAESFLLPFTDKQRAKAEEILERYEGGPEPGRITKLPPGAERYFKQP